MSGRAMGSIPAGKGGQFAPRSCGYSRAAGVACLRTDRETVSRIWDVRSGGMIAEISGHMPDVWSAIMSPDGRLVAFTNRSRVEIWDARSGELLSRIDPPTKGTIGNLDFDLSGRKLVSTGSHQEPVARIWDSSSGKLVGEFRGDTHGIAWAHFSTDGRLIVTANGDNSAGVWSTTDGRQLMTLRGHQNTLWDAIFSPDNQRVLTVSADGTARIYDVSLANPLPDLLRTARARNTRELTVDEAARFLH